MIDKIENFEHFNLIQTEVKQELFNYIKEEWDKNGYSLISWVYFAILVDIKQSESLRKKFLYYHHVLPDGLGIELYFKSVFNKKLIDLNGTDLMPLYIEFMKKENMNFAFYGTNKINIELSSKKYEPYYYESGYENIDWTKIKDKTTLLIGLGTPKQEEFIHDNLRIIKEKNLQVVSVGGFFDFASGNIKRAPLWLRKIRLEFLFRFLLEPKKQLRKNLLNFYLFYYILKDKRKLKAFRISSFAKA